MPKINTEQVSEKLRAKAIDVARQKILVTRLAGSKQEPDIHEPINCDGFGRIRHFRRQTAEGWPENPLPIDPAANRLGTSQGQVLKAQVFQNAACNWRCWYCYVPFELLSANPKTSAWLSAGEILDLYESLSERPKVIDLSGGQPDLTPEWVPWMMRELRRRGLDASVFLWSDDNLSNDYFWKFLAADEIDLVRSYRNYGKVCCFKGFDPISFSFNTGASPELFDQQFQLFRQYAELDIDLYAYTTFTSPCGEGIHRAMARFVDKLQEIHPHIPLRTIPLEIRTFSAMQSRVKCEHEKAIHVQTEAIACWNYELNRRFSASARQRPIYEIPLSGPL
jgi:uncharacterized Fe-S cluster-containing radical SAM superfamily protein